MSRPYSSPVQRPTPDICGHGRPDHHELIRQLAEAMGIDLPAMPISPEQVWNWLLDEVLAARHPPSAASHASDSPRG